MPYNHQKKKKLALELGIQTYQILKNYDEVCISSLSNILLAVLGVFAIEQKTLFINPSVAIAKMKISKLPKLYL